MLLGGSESDVRRFRDQHTVYSHDVRPGEGFHDIQDVLMPEVTVENFIVS